MHDLQAAVPSDATGLLRPFHIGRNSQSLSLANRRHGTEAALFCSEAPGEAPGSVNRPGTGRHAFRCRPQAIASGCSCGAVVFVDAVWIHREQLSRFHPLVVETQQVCMPEQAALQDAVAANKIYQLTEVADALSL